MKKNCQTLFISLQGVQLHQDERQNLWATRLGKNPIFVRGHTLCPELVKLNGKLTQGVPMKVLDTAAFKDYMREEVEKNGGVNEDLKDRIMGKLKVSAETIVFRLYICFFFKGFIHYMHTETLRNVFAY